MNTGRSILGGKAEVKRPGKLPAPPLPEREGEWEGKVTLSCLGVGVEAARQLLFRRTLINKSVVRRIGGKRDEKGEEGVGEGTVKRLRQRKKGWGVPQTGTQIGPDAENNGSW